MLFRSHYFNEIGQYDKGMNLWGGENLELSLRVIPTLCFNSSLIDIILIFKQNLLMSIFLDSHSIILSFASYAEMHILNTPRRSWR